MGEQSPTGWRSDEQGNVYRLLTPSERAQIERARRESADAAEDESGSPPASAADATAGLTRAS